ncbi:MAG: Uma2 family endonuclease [Elainella sp. C42_A2020_010]|nr:Uma2 family endonuclease [Elainella sp. C42_A2020_010]
MQQLRPRFQSFDEYLAYDDGTNRLYELFNGELIEVPPESGINVQIANRLFLRFALLLESDRVRGQGLELEVRGEPQNRYPDLTIIRDERIGHTCLYRNHKFSASGNFRNQFRYSFQIAIFAEMSLPAHSFI